VFFSITCYRLNSSELPSEHLLKICRKLIARYDAFELDAETVKDRQLSRLTPKP
jgi:hypothetical protein